MALLGDWTLASPQGAPVAARLDSLTCPRCGMAVMLPARGCDELCPRCLARTGGALSVTLTPCEPGRGHRRSGFIGRLTGTMRR